MSNSETKKKKSLSGATMGMRFMQRKMGGGNSSKKNSTSNGSSYKTPTKDPSSSNAENTNNDKTPIHPKNDEEWEINGGSNDDNKMDIDQDEPNTDHNASSSQQHHPPLQNQHQDFTSSSLMYEITTSSIDMYGISSEIIGRRSYNNFNKSVEETYVQALDGRRKQKIDSKVEKEQISDEELLKRYEQYVKGERTDLRANENNVPNNDIGNLKAKLAKKRKR